LGAMGTARRETNRSFSQYEEFRIDIAC